MEYAHNMRPRLELSTCHPLIKVEGAYIQVEDMGLSYTEYIHTYSSSECDACSGLQFRGVQVASMLTFKRLLAFLGRLRV